MGGVGDKSRCLHGRIQREGGSRRQAGPEIRILELVEEEGQSKPPVCPFELRCPRFCGLGTGTRTGPRGHIFPLPAVPSTASCGHVTYRCDELPEVCGPTAPAAARPTCNRNWRIPGLTSAGSHSCPGHVEGHKARVKPGCSRQARL